MENKNYKDKIGIVIIFIGIIFFLICIIIFFLNNPIEDNLEKNRHIPNVSKIRKIIKEPHWSYMPLTYSFDENCVGSIIDRIYWSFQEIENRTGKVVKFQEGNNNTDITFICHKESSVEAINEILEVFTYGLAKTQIYGNLIISAKIEFWGVSETTRPISCNKYPRLELHEILHTFGFEHISHPYSIMRPYSSDCVARDDWVTRDGRTFQPIDKIDDEIITKLIEIYS